MGGEYSRMQSLWYKLGAEVRNSNMSLYLDAPWITLDCPRVWSTSSSALIYLPAIEIMTPGHGPIGTCKVTPVFLITQSGTAQL